eukprot:8165888-Alexandrium_andersonii.AAC.1
MLDESEHLHHATDTEDASDAKEPQDSEGFRDSAGAQDAEDALEPRRKMPRGTARQRPKTIESTSTSTKAPEDSQRLRRRRICRRARRRQ